VTVTRGKREGEKRIGRSEHIKREPGGAEFKEPGVSEREPRALLDETYGRARWCFAPWNHEQTNQAFDINYTEHARSAVAGQLHL